MDGKGRALDNIWIERFWKCIKYDYIYLHPAEDGLELYGGVQDHVGYYHDKIHQTTGQTPNERYKNLSETPHRYNLARRPFGIENGEYYTLTPDSKVEMRM